MIRLHVYILQENLLLIGFSEKFLKIYKTIPEMEVLKHPFIVKDYRTLKDKEQCFFFCIHEENSSQLSLHKKFSFSQKDFFNKCVQIRRKLRMYFCAVYLIIDWRMQISIRWESSSRTVFNFFYESITLSNSLDFLIIIGISANSFSWRLFLI